MDNQTKIIIGLLILVVILTGVFFLKITGKIETTKSKETKMEENIIDKENSNQKDWEKNQENIESSENVYDSKQNNKKDKEISQSNSDRLYINIEWYRSFAKKYSIIIFIITIFINLGVAKMYIKIGMPTWTVALQIISPFIALININSIQIFINILKFVSFVLLYKKLDAFRVELGSYKIAFIGAMALIAIILLIILKNIVYALFCTVGILMAILVMMFHIKMCLNLANNFDKGKGFKLGLIFLPTIFQSILGYQNNNTI